MSRLAFIPLMLPSLVDEPPEGEEWLHEIKHDGYRTELVLEPGRARAFTRKGLDWTQTYRPIVAAAAKLPCGSAILDGEVIVQDPQGRADFHALRAGIASRSADFIFMGFDLLHLDGEDLRPRPLEQRKARLAGLFGPNRPDSPLQFSQHVEASGAEFLAAADALGLEGVVSKKRSSRYRSGRVKSWLKIKTFEEEELVVVGVERSDRAPSALLARETGDGLAYVGTAGVSLPEAERDRFWRTVERLKIDRPPLVAERAIAEGSWVRPEIRLRVRHLRGEEPLRHASVKAIVALPAAASRASTTRRAPARSKEPSYPKPHLPPRDELLAYYERVAPLMLPFLRDRPLNLFRCEGGRCFFQRNRTHPDNGEIFPAPIHKLPIAQKNGRTEDYLFIDSAEGLLACVERNTVEFHAWGSRAGRVERPDRIAIDLDPGEGIDFAAVRDAAFQVRDALAALGLKSWPLLTGGKGVHVVIPFEPEGDWPAVRQFAYRFCQALAEAAPERFTVALPKAERRGRIFLDYLRNQRTATAIMPFSLRAREGAPIALPVTWRKLRNATSAALATIRTAHRRDVLKLPPGWGEAEQRLPQLG